MSAIATAQLKAWATSRHRAEVVLRIGGSSITVEGPASVSSTPQRLVDLGAERKRMFKGRFRKSDVTTRPREGADQVVCFGETFLIDSVQDYENPWAAVITIHASINH